MLRRDISCRFIIIINNNTGLHKRRVICREQLSFLYCLYGFRLKEASCKAKKAAQSKEATLRCEAKSEKIKSDDLSAEIKRLRQKVLQVGDCLHFFL